ncbi:protein fem-1 homolog CG6966 isoform X2 [Homalodisca vitripennis]|nr:protein fem-1 homolog CG6966 isoform X2 [Homalodisca vitripennis]
MDFKNVVYNAARDGKLRRLKVFLDHRSAEEVLMLVGSKTNGATPLVMACRNGHYQVVEYLVERCNADIEQVGSVVFDGETIEGAPPLWCAAAAGHFPVVKFLVKRGASVNSTTRTNSTPLRAACFDGHFEIVKFLIEEGADIEVSNRHGHTCLMIACYKGHFRIAQYLLTLGANVNRKSVKGNTALHDCAESGSLDILKLLIQQGAKMDVDSYGMTPLLAASVTGHSHIVEYLIEQDSLVSRSDRIEALELLGATYVDKKRDMIGALDLWKRAMALRFEEGQMPMEKPLQPITVEAYEHTREIRVPEELEDLLADPDEMRMQALLIRERILGPAHPDTSYYIRYRGAVYADAGKFARCVALWSYALEMQQTMLEPLNPMTQSSLFSFTELFSFMMDKEGNTNCRANSRGRRVPAVAFQDILSVLERAIAEVRSGVDALVPPSDRDPAHLHRVLVISLHLACLLARIMATFSDKQRHLAHQTLYSLVSQNVRGRLGQTPLHLVCSSSSTLVGRYQACRFPSPDLVDMLLEVGADVNARDDLGNTPLHLAASNRPCPPALARVLLAHGAHLDARDGQGRTFRDLLQGQELHHIVNPLHYTKLSCLAARVVRDNNIKFHGQIPYSLNEFVLQH